jgi:FtsP/CotA-like multicopper oxidase with cupredoxin domain
MNTSLIKIIRHSVLLIAAVLVSATGLQAAVQGVTGTTFNLEAKSDYILTSDGDSFLMWGYTIAGNRMQYPGPTLIVNQNAVITINLTNQLGVPTSIIFPGQKVTATGGSVGLLTNEAPAGGTVTYTFTASEPGTYLYRSGTRSDVQTEMGLVGALVVRPSMGANYAYNHADTAFDREFLLLITEMDPMIHRQVESGGYAAVDMTAYFPTNWLINGRNFPDDMAENFVSWLPTQPYNFQPIMHPGEVTLVRSIGGGVDSHPFHYHGNDFDVIAEDGRMLSSGPGNGPDLAWKATTRRIMAASTTDVLWTWTGEELGWDIYGHDPGVDYPRADINAAWSGNICDNYVDGDPDTYFDTETKEYCPDHAVPFPVIIPPRDSLAFGQFYNGSPFLGGAGDLPAGNPGLNSAGGYFYMWHSHTEKELTSNDLWPGGLVSFMIIEHPVVSLP